MLVSTDDEIETWKKFMKDIFKVKLFWHLTTKDRIPIGIIFTRVET